MANEKRLIDANAVLKWLEEITDPKEWMVSQYNADWIWGMIDSHPTVDAVEVVRCKDCKYQIKEWHPDNRMIGKGYYTYGCDRNFHLYSSNAVNGHDNEFCSHGERRADG